MQAESRHLGNGEWGMGNRESGVGNREWGMGTAVIERLAKDLQQAFPGVKGFSARNIWRMRAFYLAYSQEVQGLSEVAAELDGQNLPQPVAEIPWG
ncbi:MAG TPA: hypothetical protein DC064_28340 [Cyanobacteria bacterium UBA9273]|nr:hypothetical protein [Cyanobacteria bacterium UBA9273]